MDITRVITESELKYAIKNRRNEIRVTGNLAKNIISELENSTEKRENKKRSNEILKGGFNISLLMALIAGGPLAWTLVAGTTLGKIITKDEYENYDIRTGTEVIVFMLKDKDKDKKKKKKKK